MTDRGPSPRVRGAEAAVVRAVDEGGTIPAGAGSRGWIGAAGWAAWDHPRGCGEQRPLVLTMAYHAGPSPRVRGAVPDAVHEVEASGTIRAGAGSSGGTGAARIPGRDHPRGCAEQTRPDMIPSISSGPSPRVRGADRSPREPGRPGGTIPAGAGSRLERSRREQEERDHPRGCGEQPDTTGENEGSVGPSPRVRGAGVAREMMHVAGGTIPAGAGSSAAACDG